MKAQKNYFATRALIVVRCLSEVGLEYQAVLLPGVFFRAITAVRGIFHESDACVAMVVVINSGLFDIAFVDELNWGVGDVSIDIHDFSNRQ